MIRLEVGVATMGQALDEAIKKHKALYPSSEVDHGEVFHDVEDGEFCVVVRGRQYYTYAVSVKE